jgi:Spx/MgsR family transcriptional regulator
MKIYGIPNCDTMKKAFTLLAEKGIDYQFVNYKKEVPSQEVLQGWLQAQGAEKIINKKGTTFKSLSDADKALNTPEQLLELMHAKPSVIKRPVVEVADHILVGLDELKAYLG